MTRRACFIFDIDGTLADGAHRLHHIKKRPKDWEAYFAACGEDGPIGHVIAVALALNSAGHFIVLVSGRSKVVEGETRAWLRRHFPFYSALYMREIGDHQDDDKLKIELLAQMREDGWEPVMAFDDRTRIVRAWRAAGVPCAQVAEGDF